MIIAFFFKTFVMNLVLLILIFRWLLLHHVVKLSISPVLSSVKMVSQCRRHASDWKFVPVIIQVNTPTELLEEAFKLKVLICLWRSYYQKGVTGCASAATFIYCLPECIDTRVKFLMKHQMCICRRCTVTDHTIVFTCRVELMSQVSRMFL